MIRWMRPSSAPTPISYVRLFVFHAHRFQIGIPLMFAHRALGRNIEGEGNHQSRRPGGPERRDRSTTRHTRFSISNQNIATTTTRPDTPLLELLDPCPPPVTARASGVGSPLNLKPPPSPPQPTAIPRREPFHLLLWRILHCQTTNPRRRSKCRKSVTTKKRYAVFTPTSIPCDNSSHATFASATCMNRIPYHAATPTATAAWQSGWA